MVRYARVTMAFRGDEIMTLELTDREHVILERVRKLLAVANDERGNENQSAVAAAKAHELLEQYNLDMALIGSSNPKQNERANEYFKGGLYKWQRNLWHSVAQLNFCMYWYVKGNYAGAKYQHRVLGRQHNVVGAEVLADYLQQAIERLAQETARERGVNVFCRPMIAFREGMANRLCERLYALRRERLAEERRKQEENEQRAQSNGSTGTGLVLASLIQDEGDLNHDFLYGLEPGTTAQRRRDAIMKTQQREEEFKKWAEANPEEYAALLEQRRRENEEFDKKYQRRQNRGRRMTAEEERRMMVEFDEGYGEGDNISLNQQINEGSSTTKRLN